MENYELKIMCCPKCKRVMKLSVFKGESTRDTYCTRCGHTVLWEEVER